MNFYVTVLVVCLGMSLVECYKDEDFEAEGSQSFYGFNNNNQRGGNLPLFDQLDFGNGNGNSQQSFRPGPPRHRSSSPQASFHRSGSSNNNGNAQNFKGSERPEGYSSNSNGNGNGNGQGSKKIHKFISIHVAPIEQPEEKQKPIKLPQKAEKHYQIVFIKAPSSSPQDAQEIHLPPPPELKTLVYVLLKKKAAEDAVRIKAPVTPKPSPPEVYFIRYKGQGQERKGAGDEEREEGVEGEDGDGEEYGPEIRK